VELQLESTSALVLLLFVIPLAFTLSGFLLWIMYALNGLCSFTPWIGLGLMTLPATINQLRARKQRYKLKMFSTLYYILLAAVVVIASFFVVSSLSFSGRLAEGTLTPVSLKGIIEVVSQIMPLNPGVLGGGYWMAG
jgi:heme/copper-type cytochrome/quinol oxidase subunit 4